MALLRFFMKSNCHYKRNLFTIDISVWSYLDQHLNSFISSILLTFYIILYVLSLSVLY